MPDRGFLLNNELTDFSTVYAAGDPNRIQGGKRPRSSMSPTIVLKRGKPVLVLGSPGGSTIITTVLQLLVNRLDLGMTLPEAMAAPRASQRNTPTVTAEQAFIDRVRRPADRARSRARARGRRAHDRSVHRRRGRDRARAGTAADGRRGADPSRRGSGPGGEAGLTGFDTLGGRTVGG